MSQNLEKTKLILSFGRRSGRKLSAKHKQLLKEYLPTVCISAPKGEKTLNIADYFDNKKAPLWLEIGFGGGEHLLNLAKLHPEVNFIGAEPYLNGVVRLLEEMQRDNIKNIRIVADDIRPVMSAMGDSVCERIYLLFPDPWPKTKHLKRRIVNHEYLNEIHRLLSSDGQYRMATDHYDYSVWMLEHMLLREDFDWLAHRQCDWHVASEDWVQTRYEQKTRKQGRLPIYLNYSVNK